MDVFPAIDRIWHPGTFGDYFYSHFTPLDPASESGSIMVRLIKGGFIPRVRFHGKLHLFMLSGRIKLNGIVLHRGDMVLFPEHELQEITDVYEDSMFLFYFDHRTVEITEANGMTRIHDVFVSFREQAIY